jgi:hypothetical protein
MFAIVDGGYTDGRRQGKLLSTTTDSTRSALPETQNLICCGFQRPSVWFIVWQEVDYGVLGYAVECVGCSEGDSREIS